MIILFVSNSLFIQKNIIKVLFSYYRLVSTIEKYYFTNLNAQTIYSLCMVSNNDKNANNEYVKKKILQLYNCIL